MVSFRFPAFLSAGVPETAVAMVAKDGERVPFHLLFHMTGAVETWLTRLASVWLYAVEFGVCGGRLWR